MWEIFLHASAVLETQRCIFSALYLWTNAWNNSAYNFRMVWVRLVQPSDMARPTSPPAGHPVHFSVQAYCCWSMKSTWCSKIGLVQNTQKQTHNRVCSVSSTVLPVVLCTWSNAYMQKHSGEKNEPQMKTKQGWLIKK